AIFIIVIAIVVPIAFVFSYAMQEVRQWLAWLIEANRVGASMPEWIAALPGVGEWLQPYWEETLGKPHALSDWIQLVTGEQLGNIYRLLLNFGGRAFEWVLSLLFMLITLFFIYKDGERLSGQLDKVGERTLSANWWRFSDRKSVV